MADPAASARPIRLHAHLLDPRQHPQDLRRAVQPPSWETFGNRTRFTVLRGFAEDGPRLVGIAEEIDRCTRQHALGEVIWPSYPTVFAENLAEVVGEVKRRGLFLFDIWGYVPGSGPGGYWTQYRPSPEALRLLETELGDHWLGMDVGEQDGRYVGGYAGQMHPASGDRFAQYLAFQRHFQHMTEELGSRCSTLVSLNFGHYLIRDGVYCAIGAETAQALPNGQVYYAWIRGAGKQYGVPWFGNASVWNRWGWKFYQAQVLPADEGAPDHGPQKGTSLSLLKRLLYSHLLYNCVMAGFENAWFDDQGNLSPVGLIQQAARQWVERHGQPGVMATPIAVMADFQSGWTFPRHLYTSHVYRVWGNLPYDAGDHLMDGVLDLLYPGYQDASYFHDERGFIAPTPYGDAADCLLSDAPAWLLERYSLLALAGTFTPGAELRDKLQAFVRAGGTLVLTSGNAGLLQGWLDGVATGAPQTFPAGTVVQHRDGEVHEEHAFSLPPLRLPYGARIIATCGAHVAAAELSCGQGRVLLLGSAFGVPDEAVVSTIGNAVDQPLAKPFPLLAHVRRVLDGALRQHTLFEAGPGLATITCRKGPCEYTVGVINTDWQERTVDLLSHVGPIESVTEIAVDRAEARALGYVPEGCEGLDLGRGTDGRLAGGDLRVFCVRLAEQRVVEAPHTVAADTGLGRLLTLRDSAPLQEQILRRPTFLQHWAGVVVDWRYLTDRDPEALRRESGWLARQHLRLVVDLTSGLNLYPDLRLVNNAPDEYARSIQTVETLLERMDALGAGTLMLALHRTPENNMEQAAALRSMQDTLGKLCAQAAQQQTTVLLRTTTRSGQSVAEHAALVEKIGAPNLSLATSTALLLHAGVPAAQVAPHTGLWLAAAPGYDVAGALCTLHAPLHASAQAEAVRQILATAPAVPVALDAVHPTPDDEYLDARLLEA